MLRKENRHVQEWVDRGLGFVPREENVGKSSTPKQRAISGNLATDKIPLITLNSGAGTTRSQPKWSYIAPHNTNQ